MDITSIPGIGKHTAGILLANGFKSVADIAKATVEQLQSVSGFGTVRAATVITEATRLVGEKTPSRKKAAKKKKGKAPKKERKKKKESAPAKKKKKGKKESDQTKKKGKKGKKKETKKKKKK